MKKLGYFSALSFVIGNIIGVGIFTTTGYAAKFIHSPKLMLLAWVFGGLYAISGAVVYGRLVKEFPLSGGDYRYLTEKVHPLAGYIFGWSALFVTYSGSIAALAIGAAWYLNGFVGIPGFGTPIISMGWVSLSWMQIVALSVIAVFTFINYRGLRLASRYQLFLAYGIIGLLILFILFGVGSSSADFSKLFVTAAKTDSSAFVVALIAILFTYIGWTSVVYMAEEIEFPAKNIPSILISGVAIVSIIYLLVNLVYLITLPIESMQNVIDVARGSAEELWGSGVARLISLLIFTAVLSTINSSILSGSRIYMVMGKDGYLGGYTSKIHTRFNTPMRSILIQSIWASVLLLSGTFNQLLSFVVFVVLLFSIGAGLICFQLLRQEGKAISFRAFTSVFYILFCGLILINTFVQQTSQALAGLLIVLPSVLFYFLDRRSNFTENN